jgi:hypothetical protein
VFLIDFLKKKPEKKHRARFDDDYIKKAEKIEARKRKLEEEEDGDSDNDSKAKKKPSKLVHFEKEANSTRPPVKAKFLGFSKKKKAIFNGKHK